MKRRYIFLVLIILYSLFTSCTNTIYTQKDEIFIASDVEYWAGDGKYTVYFRDKHGDNYIKLEMIELTYKVGDTLKFK